MLKLNEPFRNPDPDSGSQNLADPTDPDPKHCLVLRARNAVTYAENPQIKINVKNDGSYLIHT